jgi:lambda repressor-like predicted transcriptional regulator
MTAARLEELAENAEQWVREGANKDLLDLARCARAWAKVEEIVASTDRPVELIGMKVKASWSFHYADESEKRWETHRAPTALEAVEAAEVKP